MAGADSVDPSQCAVHPKLATTTSTHKQQSKTENDGAKTKNHITAFDITVVLLQIELEDDEDKKCKEEKG